jgi:hypothetical protein
MYKYICMNVCVYMYICIYVVYAYMYTCESVLSTKAHKTFFFAREFPLHQQLWIHICKQSVQILQRLKWFNHKKDWTATINMREEALGKQHA